MNKLIRTNVDAGFPANESFLAYLENQNADLHFMFSDELMNGVDHIVKGVKITKDASSITLGEGVVLYNFEIFKFAGDTLATTDLAQVEFYVNQDMYSEVFGDNLSHPAYNYRTLEARVVTSGNFKNFKRSFVIPIREYAKEIKVHSITSTVNHSVVEHKKGSSKVNASLRTSSFGTPIPYFFPLAPSTQGVFDVYSVSGFKTYTRRLSGSFSTLWFDANNILIGGVAGHVVQEGTMFYFYSNAGVKLTISEMTGVLDPSSQNNSQVVYADVMFELDVITYFI